MVSTNNSIPESLQNELPRELGLVTATAVVIASMIGTGIFTTTGLILAELPSPATVMLCWVVGGLFALSGALCYAELGAMFPQAGGEYVYLRESLGQLAVVVGGIGLIELINQSLPTMIDDDTRFDHVLVQDRDIYYNYTLFNGLAEDLDIAWFEKL